MPAGTVETLLKPENKGMLTSILTYHVVPGRLTEAEIDAMNCDGGGKAMLKTVQGEELTFERSGGRLWVIDAKGDKAEVTIPNVMQSNGVIQVINRVAAPELSVPYGSRGGGGRALFASRSPRLYARRAGCAGRAAN